MKYGGFMMKKKLVLAGAAFSLAAAGTAWFAGGPTLQPTVSYAQDGDENNYVCAHHETSLMKQQCRAIHECFDQDYWTGWEATNLCVDTGRRPGSKCIAYRSSNPQKEFRVNCETGAVE